MDSILTDNKNCCFFSTRSADCKHHLIFGTSNRKLAEEDGLKVPISNYCHNMGPIEERIHNNPMAEKLSKMLGQAIWEKQKVSEGYSLEEARNAFRKRYSKSWL